MLAREYKPFCGGSIISPSLVVTAAHCTYDRSISAVMHPTALHVLVGEHDIEDNIPADRFEVSTINNHPDFHPSTLAYDVSILTLTSYIPFPSKASPVCLPAPLSGAYSEYPDYTGQVATVTGWGETSTGGTPVLQEVDVTVVSNEDCSDAYEQIQGYY